MTRIGAGLASLAITTVTAAVVTEAPAHADTTLATTASLSINNLTKLKAQYGNFIGFTSASVTDSNSAGVTLGSTVLQRQLPGKTWADVRTDADGSDGYSYGTYGSTAKGNVRYRLHYLGATDPDTLTTYQPSFSNVVKVTTLWNFKDTSACPRGHCHISGRLIPHFKHHKIIVEVKHGTWKPYRVVRTSSRATYKIGVSGSRRGTLYRMIITGTRSITATRKDYRVILVSGRGARSAQVGISSR